MPPAPPTASSTQASPARDSLRFLAPVGGWMILLAGLALTAAVVLAPARRELDDARRARDAALAIETRGAERLRRHRTYLDALDRGDDALLVQLAAAHLREVPRDWEVLLADAGPGPVNVEAALEPPPQALDPVLETPQALPPSIFERLTASSTGRLGLLLLGGACVVTGAFAGRRPVPVPAA